MKKIYSYVLMAAALLIGTNAWAEGEPFTLGTAESGAHYQTLQAAIDAAPDAQTTEIDLISNLATSETAWLGTTNVTDAAKTIVLDLNGNTYDYTGSKNVALAVTHGVLDIKSTGDDGIIQTATAADDLVRVYGTYEEINVKEEAPFAHLIVREGVKLKSTKKNVLSVDVMRADQPAKFGKQSSDIKYACNFFNPAGGGWGVANGVRIDIYGKIVSEVKYGIKVNGCVRYLNDYLNIVSENEFSFKDGYPYLVNNYAPKYVNGANTGTYEITKTGGNFSPYVYIASTGYVSTHDSKPEAVAAYSSGYARWRIEGYCGGSTGLYVKSGVVEVVDAVIESTNTTHTTPTGKSSGVDAGGSAIVVESNASYSGNTSVTISGDTKVEASSGYALEETVTTAKDSEVEGIVIEGGTFVGGDAGAIIVTDKTQDSVMVVGGSIEGTVQLDNGYNAEDVGITEFIPDGAEVHSTEVEVDGKTTVVISQGTGPGLADTNTSWDVISDYDDWRDAKWTGTGAGAGEGFITGTVKLGELQILSATAEAKQELTIEENGTLIVNSLTMNKYAQIFVEPGGKLIVKQNPGASTQSVNNIVLEANETEQATFLFDPAVTSGRRPEATVMLTTKAKQTGASEFIYERFAIPTYDGELTNYSIDGGTAGIITFDGAAFGQGLYGWSDASQDWAGLAAFKDMRRFKGYQLTNNSLNGNVVYVFKGNLVGNNNQDFSFAQGGFGFFGNSYTADINIKKFLDSFDSNMQKTVWIYDPWADAFKTITTSSYGSVKYGNRIVGDHGPITDIRSMQAFIMMTFAEEYTTTAVNYASAIWGNPKYGLVNAPAPARFEDFDGDRVTVYVATNSQEDEVTFFRRDEYSDAFDNGADASKWMNKGMNIYVTTELGDMSNVATDNVEGITVTFQSGNESEYTLGFDNLIGEEYVIRDILTGTEIRMSEGVTYRFTQEPNTTIPARFQIVGVEKVMTGVEDKSNAPIMQKVLQNGNLYILRDDKKYSAQGQLLK